MLQWYGSLSPEQQAFLQGLIVMALFAIVRAVAAWRGTPLGETAAAKLGNYLAVAVATAGTTLLSTGATADFWFQWVFALFTAVGSWEGISKTYKPLKQAAEAAAFGIMPYALLVALVLATAVTIAPAQAQVATPGALSPDVVAAAAADTKTDEAAESPFSGSVIGALEGPAFGGAISYHAAKSLWVDAGVKRERGDTDEFAGLSTDWPLAQKTLKLLGIDAPAALKGWRYGGGYLFERNETFFYAARDVLKF